jgi:hypothetical protein
MDLFRLSRADLRDESYRADSCDDRDENAGTLFDRDSLAVFFPCDNLALNSC